MSLITQEQYAEASKITVEKRKQELDIAIKQRIDEEEYLKSIPDNETMLYHKEIVNKYHTNMKEFTEKMIKDSHCPYDNYKVCPCGNLAKHNARRDINQKNINETIAAECLAFILEKVNLIDAKIKINNDNIEKSRKKLIGLVAIEKNLNDRYNMSLVAQEIANSLKDVQINDEPVIINDTTF